MTFHCFHHISANNSPYVTPGKKNYEIPATKRKREWAQIVMRLHRTHRKKMISFQHSLNHTDSLVCIPKNSSSPKRSQNQLDKKTRNQKSRKKKTILERQLALSFVRNGLELLHPPCIAFRLPSLMDRRMYLLRRKPFRINIVR